MCSTRPPSQPFQLRVIVAMTATARRTTINGVPYFCQAGLIRDGAFSTTLGCGWVAGIGEVAMSILLLKHRRCCLVYFCKNAADDASRDTVFLCYPGR